MGEILANEFEVDTVGELEYLTLGELDISWSVSIIFSRLIIVQMICNPNLEKNPFGCGMF